MFVEKKFYIVMTTHPHLVEVWDDGVMVGKNGRSTVTLWPDGSGREDIRSIGRGNDQSVTLSAEGHAIYRKAFLDSPRYASLVEAFEERRRLCPELNLAPASILAHKSGIPAA